ncbi:Clas90 [Clostera anastomosis granulovirus B]|uniref:Clas90 n=1 Tax=Clostera anastomosis granulovirus B TaxID=1986290 RepID=A0A0K0WSN3_9BBAC|nr:Clas90 [Clostera anastomosis granulovirus B]AKS25433.1 Clas90 [Clostera anastomosis granulovirus B]
MIKRSVVDISTINNGVAVEPIPLKLSHNQKTNDNDTAAPHSVLNEEGGGSFTSFMWILMVSCVLIILVIFLVSYFIINHVNGEYTGSGEYYDDDDNDADIEQNY